MNLSFDELEPRFALIDRRLQRLAESMLGLTRSADQKPG
jgi:hypothetical protein